MILQLPNSCRIGKMSVYPTNWESKDADLSVLYVHYRFQDPDYKAKYPKGYPVKRRIGKEVITAADRRREVRGVLNNERRNLERGFNPILNRFVETSEFEIAPDTPFALALEKAFGLLQQSKSKNEIRKSLPYIQKACAQLHYDIYPVGQVRRKHVAALLEKIARNKEAAAGRPWGAPSYNHYRAYLIMLFRQLDICEACEVNLEKLPIRKGIKRRRVMLTDAELERIDKAMRAEFYTFWRFIHIFHRSGARMSEVMQLKKEHVDLAGRRAYVVVRKRAGDAEEMGKTITGDVLSLWQEVYNEAQPGQFLFARGLRPGSAAINEHQVTRRWRTHVKKKLGIRADFYSLKKKNTTEIVSKELEKIRLAQQAAAAVNSHTGTAMVEKHYDDLSGERLHQQLRAI